MPARTLPFLTPSEVSQHKSSRSCYVTLGSRVFDVTAFLDDHPGGGDLILEYGGRDVGEIMDDELSHTHSEAAYDVLEDHLVGFLPESVGAASELKTKPASGTRPAPVVREIDAAAELRDMAPPSVSASKGLTLEADLSLETDADNDLRTNKFLDLNRPLLMQVWNGGFSREFYLEQVHKPRHYKSGQSAPLFGNFLEPLSKTAWWIIPTLWLPPMVYGTILSRDGLSNWGEVAALWLTGLAIWTVVEYGLHRCLFHIDRCVVWPFSGKLHLTLLQLFAGQSNWDNATFLAARNPSLLANGQATPGDAANIAGRTRHSFLAPCPPSRLLELVWGGGGLLRWTVRIHLLRCHALLPAPSNVSAPFLQANRAGLTRLQVASLLPRAQEVPPAASLFRSSEWLRRYQPVLGPSVWNGAGSAKSCQSCVAYFSCRY